MRAAVIVLAGFACGGGRAPATTIAPVAAAVAAPPPPLELAIVDAAGALRVERWTEQMAIPEPTEDAGVFAYAQRMAVLHTDDVDVGWLEPGARVGVVDVSPDRVDIALFGWTGASLRGHPRAWVDPRALGPTPPRDAPPFGVASHAERTIGTGQYLRRLDGVKFAYTFCGSVEVIEQDDRGLRIIQREDGVALEGRVDANAHWQDDRCPGLAVIDGGGQRQLVYHDRRRAHRDHALPSGLVEAGPFDGPTFAQLVARRATIYWLLDGDRGPTCDPWQLVPPKHGDDDGELVQRTKLDDGDTLITHFGVVYGDAADASVVLLGPSSEVVAPRGRKPKSGGVSFACGSDYVVVASEHGMMTMHHRPPSLAVHVLAYDPRDTEPWYTDRARCERDAEARRQKVAGALQPHRGC